MMPLPPFPSNQKMPVQRRAHCCARGGNAIGICATGRLALKERGLSRPHRQSAARHRPIPLRMKRLAGLLAFTLWCGLLFSEIAVAQDQDYEREELGVNEYTAPSIAHIFQRLDELKPLPCDQLRRPFVTPTHASREQMGLVFGRLVADGFLVVACERKNLVDDVGRVLLRQARSLGVGNRVIRHSASLTELGRRGAWSAVRKELGATQADVEEAMVELRDQKMAHLISLGGWLRGLEIASAAVENDFSPERANALIQPELADYFSDELKTLPPAVAITPLFEKIRAGMKVIRQFAHPRPGQTLTIVEVRGLHQQARELNRAIQHTD